MRDRSVVVVNSGSSSLKFALFTLEPEPALLRRGTVEGLAGDRIEHVFTSIAAELDAHPLAAIAHRIVHGGPSYHRPAVVDRQVLDDLRDLVPLAPNHLPQAIALVDACRRLHPSLPQIACFDTAFYAGLPPEARRLPIPQRFDDQGIRRYGFHGLAFTFLLQELGRLAPAEADGRVVLAHLGNGASLTATLHRQPIDTTMGFTPIGGVVMSTRAGDLDPGVVTHLARTTGDDPDGLERLLSRESGLAGISGRSGDVRELLAAEGADDASRLAVAVFCYEIKKRVGGFAAALGGLDALVFSGGIGEHAPEIRRRICDRLDFLGIAIDPVRNAANATVISTDASAVRVRVIAANEELVIAGDAYRLLH
jgi:acetate kinase